MFGFLMEVVNMVGVYVVGVLLGEGGLNVCEVFV